MTDNYEMPPRCERLRSELRRYAFRVIFADLYFLHFSSQVSIELSWKRLNVYGHCWMMSTRTRKGNDTQGG